MLHQKTNELIVQLRQHAYTTAEELKTLHTNVLTKSFEATTFRQALEETILVWAKRATPKYKEKMQIHFDCPQNLEIPIRLRNTIIRIASLAFSNALRHSGIIENPEIHVVVKVEQKDDMITLAVIDNGRGIDYEKTPPGFGLDRMRQLAQKINTWGEILSDLQIKTGINQGTKVLLYLRIRPQKVLA